MRRSHDTANAMATSIATGALNPRTAVLPSSSSHALFGGLIGATIVAAGLGALNFGNVLSKVDGHHHVYAYWLRKPHRGQGRGPAVLGDPLGMPGDRVGHLPRRLADHPDAGQAGARDALALVGRASGPAMSPVVGTAVAALCLSAVAAIVVYGLALIIFHH